MKGSFKKVVSLILIAVLATVLVGCGGKTEPAGSGDQGAKAKKDTLTVAIEFDPITMDPHAAGDTPSVNNQTPVYETLVVYDQDSKIAPMLAESWEQIDAKNWKFNLRKGVKFHNGEEMKASDVLFSFKRATSPEGVKVQYVMGAIDAANCKVVDDYTIIVATKEPFSPLIGYLPYIGASIVSEKEFTADPEKAKRNPVGTGPFKFVEWKKNDRCVYVRNDEYWGNKPAYKNLIIRTIVEANSRVIELESGTIDIAYNIPANDVARLESNPNTKIVRNKSTLFNYIGMVNDKAPFNNPDFRTAIDLALDEEAIVKTVYRGIADYTPTSVTPICMYFDDSDTKPRYNPEEAKALLKKAGIAQGTTYSITIYEDQAMMDAATVIQSMLKEVGINLEIKVLEFGTFFTGLEAGDYQFFLSSWGAVGFTEPDNNLFGPLHGSMIPASNSVHYNSPVYNELLTKSRATPNGPEREKMIKDAQKLLRKDVPMITYANKHQIVGTRADVKGFKPSLAESHFVRYAYFE